MEDVVQAVRVIATTAGEIGMTRDELRKAGDLLQKYSDERDRLFDEMLSLLRKSDASNVADDWKICCEKGDGLLESLNSGIPPSPNGEGLNGVGARDFYDGEKKMWKENGKAQIALAAELLSRVFAANDALIEKCNGDLKTARDGNAELQAQLSENLDGIKSDVLDAANTVTTKLTEKTLTAWMKEGGARDYIGKWSELIGGKTEAILLAARQKGALRKQILDNIELLNNAKDQLDEKWIDDTYRTAEDCAKSLASSGETGDYRAVDWAAFGESCIAPLAESRDGAKEKSRTVFDEILPTFLEESNTAFASLTGDRSRLDTWKSDLEDKRQSTEEALATEDELIKDLAEGPYQQAARGTFDEFRLAFSDGIKLLFDKTKDAEDEIEK